MRKNLLIMVVCLMTTITFAQNNQDVVYLKNGSVIRGVITEQIPNKSLKIETADGNFFVYRTDEVESMTIFLATPQSNYQNVVYLKNGSIIRGTIIEQVSNESLKIETVDRNQFVCKINEIEKINKDRIILQTSSAQQEQKALQQAPLQFGMKAGVNMNNFGESAEDYKAKIGFNIGVTMDYAFTPEMFLMIGLELTTKGARWEDKWSGEDIMDYYSSEEKETYNPMYLQLPVHFGYKIGIDENTKIVLQAGPYFAYGIGGKWTYELKRTEFGETETEKEKFDVFGKEGIFIRFDLGVGIAVGAEFGQFGVKLGCDLGLRNMLVKNELGTVKIKNRNAYLSVGYKF